MRRVVSAAICCVLSLLLPTSVEARPMSMTCVDAKTCQASCAKDDLAACTRLAGMHQRAEGVALNMTKAVKLYQRACSPMVKVPNRRLSSYSWACYELSRIYKTGWMFELEPDVQRADALYRKAKRTAKLGCQRRHAHDCYTEVEIEVASLRAERWPRKAKDFVSRQIVAKAEWACRSGHVDTCVWLREMAGKFASHKYISAAKRKSLHELTAVQYRAQCGKHFGRACLLAGKHTPTQKRNAKAITSFFDKGCKLGNQESCARYVADWVDHQGFGIDRKGPKFQRILKKFFDSCNGAGHDGCEEVIRALALGAAEIAVKQDVKRAFALVEARCMYHGREVCEESGALFLHKVGSRKVMYDRKRAIRMYEQACLLTPHGDKCRLCDRAIAANHRICKLRKAWGVHQRCTKGQFQQCTVVGDMFRKGKSVTRDLLKAGSYYRRACDGAEKGACVTLKTMCRADAAAPVSARKLQGRSFCHQSLIHSDFFYEAEWQYRRTGIASIRDPNAKAGTKDPTLPSVATAVSTTASAGVQLKRGSINAELVMSVVLDRARQAAIRLVVTELRRRGNGTVPGYLHDLLTQAALLLADQGTLRREKFQDLAMTVVRAFIASNAIKTVYASDKAIVKAKLWARLAKLNKATWDAKAIMREAGAFRKYLVDWAYFLLGKTKLFGRAVGSVAKKPTCPFEYEQGKKLCGWLASPTAAKKKLIQKAVRIDAVLNALSLAKLIKSQGGVDLRRFIEALGNARSIGDLAATPGLNLKRWESEIVVGFEKRLHSLEAQSRALRQLLSVYTYHAKTDWRAVEGSAKLAQKLIANPLFSARLGAEGLRHAKLLIDVILNNKVKKKAPGFSAAGPTAGEQPAPVDARIAKLRPLIRGWRTVYQFSNKLAGLTRDVVAASKPLLALKHKAIELRAAMRRLHRGREVMRIDTVPLYGLSALRKLFGEAIASLQSIEKTLSKIYPGAAGNQLRMAQSAVIRLLSFFDLMDRVARKARHSQSLSDITRSLRLLGTVRNSRFSAPLFDVLEPVLHAIQGHKPIDANVLFAILSKVRLDSLITTLASTEDNPCRSNERGTECWTVKVIHALQESIQSENNTIRVDGGKFAKRLAQHGDNFRRRHKGGTFFHLTIGFGGLYSVSPPKVMSSGTSLETGKNRLVPLIGEQIGFGYASPTFWGDRITLKAGVFASGILYRMLLDSSESKAVMLSPFVAVDLFDLVELYVAPSLLLYPPIGDSSVGAKVGVSFGLTVPLGAYLEKL